MSTTSREAAGSRLSVNQSRRRASILANARSLLAEFGYDGVTMRGLAEVSGVGLMTLYRYYSDKDDLLRAAVRDRNESIYAEVLRHPGVEGLDRIFLTVDIAAQALADDPMFFRAALLGSPLDHYDRAFDEFRGRFYEDAFEQIGAAGGLVPWINLSASAYFLSRLLRAPVLQWATGMLPESRMTIHGRFLVCSYLYGLTVGGTHERVAQLHRELNAQL